MNTDKFANNWQNKDGNTFCTFRNSIPHT